MLGAVRGENPAERLVDLGAHLGRAGRHRLAALAYASAAGGSSGASPRSRANALYLAARHLHQHAIRHPDTSIVEDDLLRARALLQKALLLARSLPDAFTRTMRLLALLEAVTIAQGDTGAATKACKLATNEMKRAVGRGEAVWHWWVYFRTRQMLSASPDDALSLAASAASLAERRGDVISAAAFHLAAAHVRVTAPFFTLDAILPALRAANAHLSQVPRDDVAEAAPLRLARVLLSGFALLRAGRAAQTCAELAQDAARALALLDRGAAAASPLAQPMHRCAWVWAPAPALRALLQHLLACALRPRGDGGAAWVHAERALCAAGLDAERADGAVLARCLDARAGRALGVAILDSAARVLLGLVDLARAAPLVSAALRLSADAGGGRPDVTRCAALLLAAEYCALSGRLEQARGALQYLDEIERAAADGVDSRAALGDVLHMAHTHRSLLTGHARTGAAADSADATYIGAHVRAAALFADGVFHMRNSRILPARATLHDALALIVADGDRGAVNEQLVANTLIVQSGLSLLREVIDEADHEPVRDAIQIAERGRDVVTEVRSKRQAYKLLSKSNPGSVATNDAHGVARMAMGRLTQVQTAYTELTESAM